MRKSVRILLTAGAAAALLACGRRAADPCEAATFDDQACRDAVANGGYYWNGTWHMMHYSHPYPFYFDSYHSYRMSGGSVSAAPAGSYSRSGPSMGGADHGGFGGAAAAHGAHGGGE